MFLLQILNDNRLYFMGNYRLFDNRAARPSKIGFSDRFLLKIVDFCKTGFFSYYVKVRNLEVHAFLLQILNEDCLYFIGKLETFR